MSSRRECFDRMKVKDLCLNKNYKSEGGSKAIKGMQKSLKELGQS